MLSHDSSILMDIPEVGLDGVDTSLRRMRERLISSKDEKLTQEELGVYFERLYEAKIKDLSPKERVSLNDTLAVWFLRANQLEQETHVQVRVDEEQILSLWEYIISFLEHNTNAAVNSLSQLSTRMLQYCKVRNDVQSVICKMVLKVSKVNHSSKFFFFLIDKLAKEGFDKQVLQVIPQFPEVCIEMIWISPLATAISKSFAAVVSDPYKDLCPKKWMDKWFSLVETGLKSESRKEKILSYLLPLLLTSNSSFRLFIDRLDLDFNNEENFNHLTRILTKGLEMSIIESPFDYFEKDMLDKFSVHENAACRLNVFRLVVQMFLSKKIALDGFLQDPSLFVLITAFLNDFEHLAIRNEYGSLFNKVINKIRELQSKLIKDLKKLRLKNVNYPKQASIEKDIRLIDEFLENVCNKLHFTMQVSGSYPQLYNGYKSLEALVDNEVLFVEDKVFSESMSLCLGRLVDLLVSNTFSAYDDIREKSVILLLKLPSTVLRTIMESDGDKLLIASLDNLPHLKGRKSERGSNVIYFLVNYYTEKQPNKKKVLDVFLELVKRLDINDTHDGKKFACYENRVHGYYTALCSTFDKIFSFLLKQERDLIANCSSQILECIFDLWTFVRPYFSESDFQLQEDEYSNSFVQTYLWRLIKSSNQLMIRVIVNGVNNSLIQDSFIFRASETAIDQLSYVDHRSTFASIYNSFVTLSEICLKSDSLYSVPKVWLDDNIEIIKMKVQRITRRSAGLPFLITGVLSAARSDTKMADELLSTTINKLILIADAKADNVMNQKHDLPQVHALNCIRQMFLDSDVKGRCDFYLVDLLHLSLKNFSSDIWAIRNCSMMLFTAIKDILLARSVFMDIQSKVTWNLLTTTYPGLETVISDNLKTAIEENQNELLFPILTILSQIEAHTEDAYLIELRKLILGLMDHRFWKVREMVARSLSSLTPVDEMNDFMHFLLRECNNPSSKNRLHSSLLSIAIICKSGHQRSISLNPDTLSKIEGTMIRIFHESTHFTWSSGKIIIDILSSFHGLKYDTSATTFNYIGNVTVKLLMEDSKKLDGSRNLFVSTSVRFILSQLKLKGLIDELTSVIGLCLVQRDNFDLHQLGLKFSIEEDSKVNIKDVLEEVWNLAMDEHTYVETRIKSFKLIERYLDNSKRSQFHGLGDATDRYIGKLSYLITNNRLTENLTCAVLECYSHVVHRSNTTEISSFLDLCEENYADDASPEKRYSAVISMVPFVSNITCREGHLARGLKVLFNGLFDNEQNIRDVCTKSLSELCGADSTYHYTYLAKNLYSLLSNTAQADVACELLVHLFLSSKIEDVVSVAKDNYRKETLFDAESVNLFKNEVERVSYILDSLSVASAYGAISSRDFSRIETKAVADSVLIEELLQLYGIDGIIGWSLDKCNYIPILITITNLRFCMNQTPENEPICLSFDRLRSECLQADINPVLRSYLHK